MHESTSGSIAADDIDARFVPRRGEGVTAVELDGRTVIYSPENGGLIELDDVGTALWGSFDGTAALAELISELATIYNADESSIADDVIAFTRHVGRLGLLQGVERGPS